LSIGKVRVWLLELGISNLINDLEIMDSKKAIMKRHSLCKNNGDDIGILIVYVDDIAITERNDDMIQQVKYDICSIFEITNLRMLHYCLGVEFWKCDHIVFVSQVKYAIALLEKFKMTECNPTSTPMEVGIKLSTYNESPPINESRYRQLVDSFIYLTAT
jgi:hypothetical protein